MLGLSREVGQGILAGLIIGFVFGSFLMAVSIIHEVSLFAWLEDQMGQVDRQTDGPAVVESPAAATPAPAVEGGEA